MTVEKVPFLLIGVGSVGQDFLDLVSRKREVLASRLGLTLVPVGVADSTGAAICPAGLEPSVVIGLKVEGRGVSGYPRWGRPGVTALEMVQTTRADLLLDASPANLVDGQPGLGCIEAALSRGMHVVTANKAPLVMAFPRLRMLASEHGVQIGFDATVAGGLPAVNLGRRDLAVTQIDRLEGVLNLTTNIILSRMADDGLTYAEALAETQAAGHAEADPRLDVDGWDAANKLLILADTVLGCPAKLADVEVQGIADVTSEMLQQAGKLGKRIQLVATAERIDGGYRLSVKPIWLEAHHPLAKLGAHQMAIVYYTDICGVISAAIVEETPMPTAAALLRDVVDILAPQAGRV